MEKKVNYTYLTINKINGKGYIGSHGTNKESDGYIGSGLYFKNAIKKYGKQNFIKINLKNYNKILDARKDEEYYIKLFDTLSPNGYNMSITGGQGKWGGKLSTEYKNKISISMIGKNKGKVPWNKGMKMDKQFCENTLKGIIEKRTPSRIGKKYKKSTRIRKNLSEKHKKAISDGLKKYKKTDLHKQHLSESMKALN